MCCLQHKLNVGQVLEQQPTMYVQQQHTPSDQTFPTPIAHPSSTNNSATLINAPAHLEPQHNQQHNPAALNKRVSALGSPLDHHASGRHCSRKHTGKAGTARCEEQSMQKQLIGSGQPTGGLRGGSKILQKPCAGLTALVEYTIFRHIALRMQKFQRQSHHRRCCILLHW